MNRDSEKSLVMRAPETNGTDDTNIGVLSMGTTHAAMALPAAWEGKYLTIKVRGTAAKSGWFLVSELSTAEVDRSVTADTAGALGATTGLRIVVGESESFQLPRKSKSSATQYLINETDDATTTAELWVSSD